MDVEYNRKLIAKKALAALNEYNETTCKLLTVRNVGQALFGVNWHIAEKPLSPTFINYIVHNTEDCLPMIVWLQFNALHPQKKADKVIAKF